MVLIYSLFPIPSESKQMWEGNSNKTRTMRNLLLSMVSKTEATDTLSGFGELNFEKVKEIKADDINEKLTASIQPR